MCWNELAIFRWILHGGDRSIPVTGVAAGARAHAFRATVQEQLKDFWTLDHLGITSDEMLKHDLGLEVKNAIQRDQSGHYIVLEYWPWKPQVRENLALNKALSEVRLCWMARKMTPKEYTAYDKRVEDSPQRGSYWAATKRMHSWVVLTTSGCCKDGPWDNKIIYYCIVHDASERSEEHISLNDALENGPSLLPLLWGVLWFWIGKVAVVGNLEKAFLQLILLEEDRDVCCWCVQIQEGILWCKNRRLSFCRWFLSSIWRILTTCIWRILATCTWTIWWIPWKMVAKGGSFGRKRFGFSELEVSTCENSDLMTKTCSVNLLMVKCDKFTRF